MLFHMELRINFKLRRLECGFTVVARSVVQLKGNLMFKYCYAIVIKITNR